MSAATASSSSAAMPVVKSEPMDVVAQAQNDVRSLMDAMVMEEAPEVEVKAEIKEAPKPKGKANKTGQTVPIHSGGKGPFVRKSAAKAKLDQAISKPTITRILHRGGVRSATEEARKTQHDYMASLMFKVVREMMIARNGDITDAERGDADRSAFYTTWDAAVHAMSQHDRDVNKNKRLVLDRLLTEEAKKGELKFYRSHSSK